MQNYVISLKSAAKRREHISNEFGGKSLDYIFFNALDPNEGLKILKDTFNDCNLGLLSSGEIACFASHLYLWQQLLHDNHEYYIIFEDDVFLSVDIKDILNELVLDLGDIDLIKIETFKEKVLVGHPERIVKDRTLHKLLSGHSGTAGYLVTKHGARKLIEGLKSKRQLKAVDHFMFEDAVRYFGINPLQINPALCIQEKVQTDIVLLSNHLDSSRNSWIRIKEKDHVLSRLIRELQRFILKIKMKFYSRTIEFR